jgi:hypothetical protein
VHTHVVHLTGGLEHQLGGSVSMSNGQSKISSTTYDMYEILGSNCLLSKHEVYMGGGRQHINYWFLLPLAAGGLCKNPLSPEPKHRGQESHICKVQVHHPYGIIRPEAKSSSFKIITPEVAIRLGYTG